MMTAVEVERYAAEFERLWRSRTPPSGADDALPAFRVSRVEMRGWVIDVLEKDVEMEDLVPLNRALRALMARLRCEFPNEMW